MPRIWAETIEAHRDAVREATLDAVGALVAEHGLTGVAMSQIAKESGIGRATLYSQRLGSVLAAYAGLSGHHGHGGDVTVMLHRSDHVIDAHARLHEFISQLIRDAVRDGSVRGDIPPGELASYCLSALAGASSLPTSAARDRLVALVLAGLSASS